jgi:hypothetical protein
MTNIEIVSEIVENLPQIAINADGFINAKQLYYLAFTKGFKGVNLKDFESYLLENFTDLNLFGKFNHKKAKSLNEAFEIIQKFKSTEVAFENAKDENYVFRTKLGNGNVVLYDEQKLTKHEVNILKGAYVRIEGVKYYDCRPCLYKNWKTWSDERKQASEKTDSFIF